MTLYERYNTGDDYFCDIRAVIWCAQTFTVGNTGTNEDHYVTSVKLLVYRTGSPGTGTVAIYDVDGEGKPNNSLCSVNYNFNNLGTDTAGTWVEFTFPSPATLSANTQYAIVVSAPDSTIPNYILWRLDTSSPTYIGGSFVYSNNSGGVWYLDTDYDFMFEVYGEAVPAQPEICDWIDDQGGPSSLTIPDVFEIVNSYLFETPPPGYSFVPTLQNVFGISDYYLGLNGDAATGCDFFP